MMIVDKEAAKDKVKSNLQRTLEDIRIKADVYILNKDAPVNDIIHRESFLSEICFLGVNLDVDETNPAPLENIDKLASVFHGNLIVAKNWEDLNAQWN